jgi:hypothetical protein
MLDGGIARARANKSSYGIPQLMKLLQLGVDRRELLLGPTSYGATRCTLPRPQRQQVLRLRQRESELGCVADKPQAGNGVLAVAAIAAIGTAGLRQEADALVVAHGLDVDPRTLRKRADRKGLVAHAGSVGAVLDYRVKGGSIHRREATPTIEVTLGVHHEHVWVHDSGI